MPIRSAAPTLTACHAPFAASPTIRPELHPPTAQWYTAEQLQTPQVKLIVESLVRTDDRYVEVIRNRLFKKIR